MDFDKKQAQSLLEDWFGKASRWQKDLFSAIWNGAVSEEQIIDRAIKLIGQEYLSEDHRLSPSITFPNDINFNDSKRTPILLTSISNVKGVGALAPQSALTFSSGLTVVYGENGCGKSSYVRILKALENPVHADAVIGNVFESGFATPAAYVTFSLDGDSKVVKWSKTSTKKYPLQIYDTSIAKQFVDKENEVIYEPKVLSTVTKMALLYEKVSAHYAALAEETSRKIKQLPQEFQDNPIVREYNTLSTPCDVDQFAEKYLWSAELDAELDAIAASLKENDPQQVASYKIAQKGVIRTHGMSILKLVQLLTDVQCADFLEKRQKQISTKAIADALISASQKRSLLKNFGTDIWKLMWQYANEYIKSMESSTGIPTTTTGQCALCQQKLDADAIARLQTFKEFAESEAMTASAMALDVFETTVRILQENIENKVSIAEIETLLQSGGISEEVSQIILRYYKSIVARCTWLLSYNSDTNTELPSIQTKEEVTRVFKEIIEKIDIEITALQKAATDMDAQIRRRNELIAVRWAVTNLTTKKQLISLETIISRCKTNMLTSLKKGLSKQLITDSYISKFQNEMGMLDINGQIKVELVATAPKKGKSYHQVSLKGACSVGSHKNGEILSEGEFRVVSLAAFLADLSSWSAVLPFIFDDPINSLDHNFEARVAKRLVQLSMERQVIVFTHRLAFAQLLHKSTQEYNAELSQKRGSERAQITHIMLRNLPLGEPSKPDYLQKISMSSALNDMIGTDIAQIKKLQKSGDYDTSDHMLQSLAARFRNLVEQGIEHELLSGVVSRFDYRVLTQKLPCLFAITEQDVALFHKMMTKYSCYDHSHSIEVHAPLPIVDDLEKDLQELLTWAKDYKKRCDEAKRKSDGKA